MQPVGLELELLCCPCITMSDITRECLTLQLLEMEMLFSMFPNKKDIILNDVNSVTITQKYLEGTNEPFPPSIEFTVIVITEDQKEKAEMNVSLPHSYPTKKPQLFVRSAGLDKQQHNVLNKCLAS
ncbi:RWD domain-containing protein 2A [Pseudophryne corroboree]|uniref:RWD domain-containing protein 2A n=1 Tax=Pseudophryne corroboree TaxID=495146 RepID=UPI003081DAFA